MKRADLVKTAKLEIAEWEHAHGLPRGVALAVLFCFIHRLETGQTVEDTFFRHPDPVPDYEI